MVAHVMEEVVSTGMCMDMALIFLQRKTDVVYEC